MSRRIPRGLGVRRTPRMSVDTIIIGPGDTGAPRLPPIVTIVSSRSDTYSSEAEIGPESEAIDTSERIGDLVESQTVQILGESETLGSTII